MNRTDLIADAIRVKSMFSEVKAWAEIHGVSGELTRSINRGLDLLIEELRRLENED